MSTFKKVSLTIALSMAAGAVLGMLYAPYRGVEARRKINRLKHKLSCTPEDEQENDRQALEEVSHALKMQLEKVNERLQQQKN